MEPKARDAVDWGECPFKWPAWSMYGPGEPIWNREEWSHFCSLLEQLHRQYVEAYGTNTRS
jgi:hypothetical protein